MEIVQIVFPFDSENKQIEESKKPGFTFYIELRINSETFRVY